MKTRLSWAGQTSTVAFVFNFVGEDSEPEDIKFDAYQEYEAKQPGKLIELTEFYLNNPESWIDDEVVLSNDQIETLKVLIQCVNEWHQKVFDLFRGMAYPNATQSIEANWDKSDEVGLLLYKSQVAWWREEKNLNYIIADVQDRVEEVLGSDSKVYELLGLDSSDELLDRYLTLFLIGAPYDEYEDLGFGEEENWRSIPEEEIDEARRFYASNVFLVDFHDASKRYFKGL